MKWINQFQPSAAFHIETSHFISTINNMTGFYVKCNIRLKMVKLFANYTNTQENPYLMRSKFVD